MRIKTLRETFRGDLRVSADYLTDGCVLVHRDVLQRHVLSASDGDMDGATKVLINIAICKAIFGEPVKELHDDKIKDVLTRVGSVKFKATTLGHIFGRRTVARLFIGPNRQMVWIDDRYLRIAPGPTAKMILFGTDHESVLATEEKNFFVMPMRVELGSRRKLGDSTSTNRMNRSHGYHPMQRTSLEARPEDVTVREWDVILALQSLGQATADQIASRLGRNKYLIMPRITGLQKKGIVEESGSFGTTPGIGKRCIVWRLAKKRGEQMELEL
jgi:DNA-binding MarR family transcriptional regulator